MVTRFQDVRRKPSPQQRADALVVGRCDVLGKFSYPTRGAARRAFKLMPGRPSSARNRAYECRHCGHWHLTSQVTP